MIKKTYSIIEKELLKKITEKQQKNDARESILRHF